MVHIDLSKGEITHLVVDMALEYGWSSTFDFDKFIFISNFKPRI